MKRINYEKNLTQAQQEAVFSPEGPTLVIAGAGSGKTRTLVYRVAWMVEQGISPERILLLTFTRKASQEMLSRVEEMLDRSCRGVAGGTFHSLAYKILRIHGKTIGLKSPLTVSDRKDSEEIVARLIKEKGWDKRKDRPDKKEFLDLLGRSINRGQTLAQGMADWVFENPSTPAQFLELDRTYEVFKREHGLLDYDDLLHLCLQLFRTEKRIADNLASGYDYVLVDEYQDTNLLQAEIVQFLARGNIMVVGDDSQSIYGFRGAHFKNILDFPRQFPGTRIIKLEENFRSSQAILSLANTVISYSRERYSKCLFSRFKEGTPPRCVELPYEEAQSRYVTQQLQEFHRQGMDWQDMAVLFRAGHHSFNLEVFLQKEGIPFKKFGGRRFVEGAHIKDVLAYLKAAHNPGDVMAWDRVLRLQEGMGPKRTQELIVKIQGCPDWKGRLEVLIQYPRPKSQLQDLALLFQELTFGPSPLPPTQALEAIWNYYKRLLPLIHDEPQRRQKEIEEIIRVSYNYEEIESFLGDLSLEVYEEQQESLQDRLTLSTVHSAKGLEWKVVFIIWLTEGRFPSTHAASDPMEMEEERRLLYVAVTRAKEKLFLTYPLNLSLREGGWQKNDLCHFIAQIPEDILKRQGQAVAGKGGQQIHSRPLEKPKEDDGGFSKGTRVFHPLFGNGVVEEPPRERKVRVFFKKFGSKVLHLDYAKLELG
ncbi:MAG TPA: ATP-dependent helicase [Thermodesulfobacteriota bacterium]|nr:ATP-dependent helicase [Thermodesulfobacteriota bacterium]